MWLYGMLAGCSIEQVAGPHLPKMEEIKDTIRVDSALATFRWRIGMISSHRINQSCFRWLFHPHVLVLAILNVKRCLGKVACCRHCGRLGC